MPYIDIPATILELGTIDSTHPALDAFVLLTNDGDTSYLEMDGRGATGPVGSNVNINFPATQIPGRYVSTSLVTVTKGTDTRVQESEAFPDTFGIGAGLLLTGPAVENWFWYEGYNGGNVFANGALDWTELETPLLIDGLPVITAEMIESGTVERFPGYAVLNDGVGTGHISPTSPGIWDSLWTYVALRVYYTAGIPPRRIFQRSDGATYGATRILGGGNTMQSGGRTIGSIL